MPMTQMPPMQAEQAAFARVPLFNAEMHVDLLRATYYTHRFAAHAHDDFAIGVIESGAVRTRVGEDTVIACAGDIVALNPGTVHTGVPVDARGYRYRCFYVGDALLRLARANGGLRLESGFGRLLHFPRPVVRDLALGRELAHAHHLLDTSPGSFAAECALIEALSELALRHGEMTEVIRPRPTHMIVRSVRAYLEENHARVVTLAELSTLTGVSPFYLSRVFRAAVGVPPYAYLALVRVRRAQELIARGFPLSLITHEAGFSDQSHFTRQFKRVVGIPPGQYAAELRRAGSRSRRHGPNGINHREHSEHRELQQRELL